MKSVLVLSFLLLSSNLLADQFVQQDIIDVDGSYAQKQMSQSDKMKLLRKKLEKQNELMVKKQIERMRLQNELELNKKIQRAFNQQMKALNSL